MAGGEGTAATVLLQHRNDVQCKKILSLHYPFCDIRSESVEMQFNDTCPRARRCPSRSVLIVRRCIGGPKKLVSGASAKGAPIQFTVGIQHSSVVQLLHALLYVFIIRSQSIIVIDNTKC